MNTHTSIHHVVHSKLLDQYLTPHQVECLYSACANTPIHSSQHTPNAEGSKQMSIMPTLTATQWSFTALLELHHSSFIHKTRLTEGGCTITVTRVTTTPNDTAAIYRVTGKNTVVSPWQDPKPRHYTCYIYVRARTGAISVPHAGGRIRGEARYIAPQVDHVCSIRIYTAPHYIPVSDLLRLYIGYLNGRYRAESNDPIVYDAEKRHHFIGVTPMKWMHLPAEPVLTGLSFLEFMTK